ncbi:peptidase A1 [Gigaspora margarita]|uniref:rhizopuspepsin n=1 Tax=Gigaspora margarita TaxID=4874 RepID=A0A8H3XAB8_GIGMA|nr:peptidase A1 [Gigaspora margarita]
MKLIYNFYIFLFLLTFSYLSFADVDENSLKEIPELKNNYTNNVPTTDKRATNSNLFHVELTHRSIDTKRCYASALIKHALRFRSNKGLSKRVSKPQALGAVNYANDVEWICQISLGTPQQSFLVALDTASSDLWVPCIDCYNCNNKRLFNYSKSSTIQYNDDDFSITYADGSGSNGWIEQDTLQVGYMTIKSQIFAIIYDISSAFQSDVIDGVLGLGYDSLSVYPGTQTPFTNMIKQGLIPQQIFSVQLRPARNKTAYGGIFVFGGIDTSLYKGSITYTPVTLKSFWQIGLDAVEYNGKAITTTSKSKQQAIVDTATALLILGTNVVTTLHTNIKGKYDTASKTWQVPCNLNSNVKVSIRINGVSFAINYLDLVREKVSSTSSWCYSGIASTDDSTWILGGVFMKNYYVIFDRAKNQVGFATPVYN